jgi:hypothetical protein
MPLPLQVLQDLTAPSFPPFPAHLVQITFRVRASLVVLPRYSSSNVTLTRWTRSLLLRGPCREGPPPPPKNPPPPNSWLKRS